MPLLVIARGEAEFASFRGFNDKISIDQGAADMDTQDMRLNFLPLE